MRDLSQPTAQIMTLVCSGETVDVTEGGKTVAHFVPAPDDRVPAAKAIHPAARPFDVADLPEPAENPTGRSVDEWLADFRAQR